MNSVDQALYLNAAARVIAGMVVPYTPPIARAVDMLTSIASRTVQSRHEILAGAYLAAAGAALEALRSSECEWLL